MALRLPALHKRSAFDRFDQAVGGELWIQSVAPANPAVANWPLGQTLRKSNFTDVQGYCFITFGGAWRNTGTII